MSKSKSKCARESVSVDVRLIGVAPTVGDRLAHASRMALLLCPAITSRADEDVIEHDPEFKAMIDACREIFDALWHVRENLPDSVLNQVAPTPEQREAFKDGAQ